MATRTTPINTARSQECIVRDVLFEDNKIEQFTLYPGQLVRDILEKRGETRQWIEVAGGVRRVNC